MNTITTYQFDAALLPDGWSQNVLMAVDDYGFIAKLTTKAGSDHGHENAIIHVPGIAVPGMPNSHCHAFQRAMAGLTEYRAVGRDTFWSWRDRMYDFAQRLTPDDVQVIATQVYMEMLKAGYTSVAEFHYLHHSLSQTTGDSSHAMADAILAAAADAGIGLTLLPTLYMTSDFGGQPPTTGQNRFIHTPDRFLNLLDRMKQRQTNDVKVGVALHSLRAVPTDIILTILDAVSAQPDLPIHIHVAEQMREVDACLAALGQLPVEWLIDHCPIDRRWALVHATHMTSDETHQLAASGAAAVLCPTTEGNLGDGFFPLSDYLEKGGRVAIGTDSNISISPSEELRWMEYVQRLRSQSRNVAATWDAPHTGERLWTAAVAGGAQASGRPIGALAPGLRADICVLDRTSPVLVGLKDDQILDALVFSGQPSPIRDVMVGGAWMVQNGQHVREDAITKSYGQIMQRLLSD